MNSKFISIGDITNDAFIKLKDATVNCDISSERCTISMRWGDKIPYESVTVVEGVGNSPNASVCASRLGLPVALVSFVGNDKHGEECVNAIAAAGVDTQYIQRQDGKSTNYHYVLSYEAERTILVRHESFNYSLPNIPENTEWIYLSSVGEAGEAFHSDVISWVDNHPNTKLIFQPGTFQMKLGYERLKEVYKRAHLFVCNKEEAQRILKHNTTDIQTLLEEMHSRGPNLVSITDGPKGAYLYDGNTTLYVPQYPDIAQPKERTGAGDAYTSTLAVFIAKGYSLKDALIRAPINAMSVVQKTGAQAGLLSEAELEKYLSDAPDYYKVKTS